MNNHTRTDLLAREFGKRLEQLGLSKREFCRRTGLSRQTLHNIEIEGRTDLLPATFNALDTGLRWNPGTALALSLGDDSVLQQPNAETRERLEGAYRWQVVERIQRMSLADLEKLVTMMEGNALGDAEPLTTTDMMAQVESRLMEAISKKLDAK